MSEGRRDDALGSTLDEGAHSGPGDDGYRRDGSATDGSAERAGELREKRTGREADDAGPALGEQAIDAQRAD